MVTGVDIVKTGIRIAAGEPIGIRQEDVGIHGWAIECRIYAEDPQRGFAPSPGEILVYRPPGGPGVRNDSGVYPGAEISVHYDPMISKLVCWGRDRSEAISRMRRALREFVVKGIKTSIPFHRAVMEHPVFLAGQFDTSFIDTQMKGAQATQVASSDEEREIAVMLAGIGALRRDQERAARFRRADSGGAAQSAWKLSGRPQRSWKPR
jgi:acetyl/propionyl-CoA carboxylase alpha subunit